tara:strand:+ start:406 stop:933 length:528 start_codon:yes stop_codon:yes gene_type:complete
MSIQLLGINEKNSSQSLIEEMKPNDEDWQLLVELEDKHEDYEQEITESEYERDADGLIITEGYSEYGGFGIWPFNYEDVIKEYCDVPVDDISYIKAYNDCALGRVIKRAFGLKKGFEESFYYLLNIFLNLRYELSLKDENFEEYNKEDFKELIKEKQEKGMPVIVHFVFYTNDPH